MLYKNILKSFINYPTDYIIKIQNQYTRIPSKEIRKWPQIKSELNSRWIENWP